MPARPPQVSSAPLISPYAAGQSGGYPYLNQSVPSPSYGQPPPRNPVPNDYSNITPLSIPPPRPYHGPVDAPNSYSSRTATHSAPAANYASSNRSKGYPSAYSAPSSGYPPPLSSSHSAAVSAVSASAPSPSSENPVIYSRDPSSGPSLQSALSLRTQGHSSFAAPPTTTLSSPTNERPPTDAKSPNQPQSAHVVSNETAPSSFNPFRQHTNAPSRPAAPPSSLSRSHSPSAPPRPQNAPSIINSGHVSPSQQHLHPSTPLSSSAASTTSRPTATQQPPNATVLSVKDRIAQLAQQQQPPAPSDSGQHTSSRIQQRSSSPSTPQAENVSSSSPRGQLLSPRSASITPNSANIRLLPPRPAAPPSHIRQRSVSDSMFSAPAPLSSTPTSSDTPRSTVFSASSTPSTSLEPPTSPRRAKGVPEMPTEPPPPRPSASSIAAPLSTMSSNFSDSTTPRVVVTDVSSSSTSLSATAEMSKAQLDLSQRRGSAPSPASPCEDYTSSYSAISPRVKQDPMPASHQLVVVDPKATNRPRSLSVGDVPPSSALTNNARQCISLVGNCFINIFFHFLLSS